METTKNKTVESKKPNLPKKEQQKNFVKVRDLSEDQFKNLDRIKCTLKKTVSKKGFTRCSLDIVIDKTLFITSIQLPDVRFNYLRLKLNFDVFDRNGREIYDYTFMAPYWFVKGHNTNGEYKSIEIILGKQLSEIYFFNDYNEIGALEILEERGTLNINWKQRPDKIDVAETINSSWNE